jgi:hypothetical protein
VEVLDNNGCFDRRWRGSGREADYLQIVHGEIYSYTMTRSSTQRITHLAGMVMPLNLSSAWMDVLMWVSQVRFD